MNLPSGLREKIAQNKDVDLYQYFAAAADYTPETLAAVKDEIRKRGLPEDQIDQLAAAARARAQKIQEAKSEGTFSIKGFGTRHYGQCDFRRDGSYVTTVWITALYWPIFPLRTIRIRPLDKKRFEVISRSQTDWQQASRTYGFVSLLIAAIWLAEWLGQRFAGDADGWIVLVLGLGAPFAWLFWSRHIERKRCLARENGRG